MTEDILQAQIFKWYHNNYCNKLSNPRNVIFAVPNGGKRNPVEAMKLKATGLVSGVSDLIVVTKEKVLFIELKLPKGKQQKTQKEFQSDVTNLGYEYHICRSLEEFKLLFQ